MVLLSKPQITKAQYEALCKRLYDLCGINLKAGKEDLVQSRLSKRIYALKLNSFEEYFAYVEKDSTGQELITMIDSLTTNKTSFFREIQHFEFLGKRILPHMKSKRLRIWSSACSSGEEPYSIGILLREEIKSIDSWDIRILATDISTRILKRAHEAVYDEATLQPVPQALRQKYFKTEDSQQGTWRLSPQVKNMVRLARLNLMEPFPMRGPFDVIFCRNVMIYFDKPTQSMLANRFYDLLAPGGYLFVGHAESLVGGQKKFRYVQPAVYLKEV